MSRINISVPDDLKEAIEARLNTNFSAIAQKAFREALGLPEPPPEPTWDKDEIIAAVREDLKQRSEIGLIKYPGPLSSRHDITFEGWVRHIYEEMLDAANYAKCIMAYGIGYFRKGRQKKLYEHGLAGFGAEYATPQERALRLLEETAEAVQAAGVPYEKAMGVVHYSYERPIGDLAQEIGQVGVTLCMLAESAGIDAEAEEQNETAAFLSRSVEYMKDRLAKKLAGGMPVGSEKV